MLVKKFCQTRSVYDPRFYIIVPTILGRKYHIVLFVYKMFIDLNYKYKSTLFVTLLTGSLYNFCLKILKI